MCHKKDHRIENMDCKKVVMLLPRKKMWISYGPETTDIFARAQNLKLLVP
jgi:hypothetical protein